MKHLVPPSLASLLTLFSAQSIAGSNQPPIGSFGFDADKPKTASCVKVDAPVIARFKSCTHTNSNNFGDGRKGYACTVSSHSQFMVYNTLADCKSELDLERANGD